LELKTETSDGKKVYQGDKAGCDICPYKARCCISKREEPRTINTYDKEPLRQRMNEKMEQESSKEIYKKRVPGDLFLLFSKKSPLVRLSGLNFQLPIFL
jgi:hypothetical protein